MLSPGSSACFQTYCQNLVNIAPRETELPHFTKAKWFWNYDVINILQIILN